MNSYRPPRTKVLRGSANPGLRLGPLAELPARARPRRDEVPSAEAAYEAGFGQGFADGFEEGRTLAAAEAAEARRRFDRALCAVAVAARSLDERTAAEFSGLSRELAEVALSLAEAILARELATAASPGADALARALALAPSGATVVARLHPDDAAVLDGAAVPAGVSVVPDAAVEPGGCLLDVGESRLDAQLGPALARARAALLGEDE